jgi:hypothetical protein
MRKMIEDYSELLLMWLKTKLDEILLNSARKQLEKGLLNTFYLPNIFLLFWFFKIFFSFDKV